MGLRVISGSQRGRKLLTVKGMGTRPTADRMREALFNILSNRVIGAHILDLFAGTGAFGIEALSRGATSAVFIDKEKAALSVIIRNIELCGLEERSRVMKWNIALNLKCLEGRMPKFDMVFMDPPYDHGFVQKALTNLYHSNSLTSGAVVVVEHSPAEPVPENFFGFEMTDQRRYGRTCFSFLHVQQTTEKERLT
jgi:16S rRNA (guanine966-N2)-methyltransferase